MKTIPVGRSYWAIVDDEDYPLVLQYSWHLREIRGCRYAMNWQRINGKRYAVSLHSLLIGMRRGFQIDHINGNGLDNRRSNLRHVTPAQNQANQHTTRGRSLFKGVRYQARRRTPWEAAITFHQLKIHIGRYATEEAAARAYDAVAKVLWSGHAKLNFPA